MNLYESGIILPGYAVLTLDKVTCTVSIESVIRYTKSSILLLKICELYQQDNQTFQLQNSSARYTLKRVSGFHPLEFTTIDSVIPIRLVLAAFHGFTEYNGWGALSENMSSQGKPTTNNIHRIIAKKYFYTGIVASTQEDEHSILLVTYRDGAQLRIRPTDSFEFRFGIRSKWQPVSEAFVLMFDETL